MTDPVTSAGAPVVRGRGVDLNRCFGEALELYRRNFLPFLIAAILTIVAGGLTLGILMGPFTGGWVLMVQRAWAREGKKAELGDLFGAFDRFGPLVGLFYLSVVATTLATLCLIVPGLLLMTAWTFVFPLVVDRGMGVFDAFGASFRIARRKGFLALLVVNLVNAALFLFAAFVPVIGFVLDWLILPFASVAWLSAYVQAVREDDGSLGDVLPPPPAPAA